VTRKRKRSRPTAGTSPHPRTLTDLAQVRVLADPLRLRMLGVFARGSHTTMQVAEELGEKPTRLYHHVAALLRAGVIELTETRPNRGTVERYYQAVAPGFHVDDSLLTPGSKPPAASRALTGVVAAILDSTRDELARVAQSPTAKLSSDAPLVARALVVDSQEGIDALRAKLAALLESRTREKRIPAARKSPDQRTYALTIAFYPVPQQGDHAK
jgi:DNA-binding transcriptional ArsR family regulator